MVIHLDFKSDLPRPLIQAYRETHFRVGAPFDFTMLVNQHSQSLASVHDRFGAKASAFITACNPLGAELTVDENDIRQRSFAAELTNRGLIYFEGVGQHPTGDWLGENSFLIIGLELENAKELARQMEQNALVWAGRDAVPRLILLR